MRDSPARGPLVSDKDAKKPAVAETVVGLPEVGGETQVGLDPVSEPVTNPALAPAVTAPALDPVAGTPLAPTDGPTTIGAPPPRRASRVGVPAQAPPDAPPRRLSKPAVPISESPTGPVPQLTGEGPARRGSKVDTALASATTGPLPQLGGARRASRVAIAAPEASDPSALDASPTNPRQPRLEEPRFEASPALVAAIAGSIALVGVAAWLFWPRDPPRARAAPPPLPLALPTPEPVRPKKPEPTPAEAPPPVAAEPDRPVLALDARTHVIDPFGMHAPDLPLDPAHKYRLRLERDDGRLGTVLARLDEAEGWGVLRKMASHAALQFGGAKALRLHCEPGRAFTDTDTFPLELVDLATKKKVEFQVFPAKHCWDLEVMRPLELGDGVRHRVRVPTDAKLKLGENAHLRVAWLLETGDEPHAWKAGVLAPGESLLAEGRRARFALLDSYAGDNDGRLELELLPSDTESTGLVSPSSASGAKFVPVGPPAPGGAK